jgi:hypothetical protein
MERCIDLKSTVFSFEALDSLLLNEFVRVESEDSLLDDILKLGSSYRDLVRHIQISFLSADGLSLLFEHFDIPSESVWHCVVERIVPPRFDSQIISDFPEIFAEFRKKQISLLWRGSRDGFGASEFHGRCDGHANTLTVILDTKGNIFGGFTPMEWESPPSWKWEADDSMKSFVFTLKNPHNIPARRFALNAQMKHHAIYWNSKYGPHFDAIWIKDNCNASANNGSSLGVNYTNDMGLAGNIVFTGSQCFKVEEIEVFEITD